MTEKTEEKLVISHPTAKQ